MESEMMRHTLVGLALLGSLVALEPAVAQERPRAAEPVRPAELIAAQIRARGYACEQAQNAELDRAASKPNEKVWTLQCNNGTYRVRIIPNMAVQVEQVKQ